MLDTSTDFNKIYNQISDQAVTRGRQEFANQARTSMEPYVPKEFGPLRDTSTIATDGSEIIYNMDYAQNQFYTQYQNYTTPGTGPRWDLKGEANHMKAYENAFKRGAGW